MTAEFGSGKVDYSLPVIPPNSMASFSTILNRRSRAAAAQAAQPSPDEHGLPAWHAFLVQWDISHFAIPLAVSAFAGMWKSVTVNYPMFDVPDAVFITLWGVALFTLAVVSGVYVCRLTLWPKSILVDFANPRTVNFFFVPTIIGCLLILAAPSKILNTTLLKVMFYMLGTYQTILSLYLYGEWLFGSSLIDFVHPVIFMQVIGYFMLCNLASMLFMVELAVGCMAVGILFWILVFVTNFQHTSSALQRRSEKPQPTFFLFIAPPAQAAIALYLLEAAMPGGGGRSVNGMLLVNKAIAWPTFAQGALYIDLFIYALIFRVFPSFWTNDFAITWWAYIFPLSGAATATTLRSRGETASVFWPILSGILVAIATVAMVIVSGATVWGLRTGKVPKNKGVLSAYCDQSNVCPMMAVQKAEP